MAQSTSFYTRLVSTPKLTGLNSVTYAANDDALKAFTVRLGDLAAGVGGAVMPFRHTEFMRQACLALYEETGKDRYNTYTKQFAIQDTFATIRNLRLMLKFNLLLMSKGLKTFVLSEGLQGLLSCIGELREKAKVLGVDVSGYMDVSYDVDDIAGCDNCFCLTQKDKAGEAGDLVTILCDEDDVDHTLVIVRKNAPGKQQVALPGGFKEGTEAAAALCNREGAEETGYQAVGVQTKYIELQQVVSKTWDPRPMFAEHGMINDGLLRYDVAI